MDDLQKMMVTISSNDEHNHKLMSWATRIAEMLGAEIDIIHVLDPKIDDQIKELEKIRFITYDAYFPSEDLIQSDEDEAEVRMAQLRRDFNVPESRCHIVKGNIAQEIVDYAENENIDLAIIGIRGQYGMVASVFNSDALKIMSHLECPVMLVPEQSVDPKDINLHLLFADDLRTESDLYMEQAMQWGRRLHASTFTALHVIPHQTNMGKIWEGVRSLFMDESSDVVMEHHERRARVKSELRQRLQNMAKLHGMRKGIRLGSMALEGDVCDELSRAVRRTLANIVVLGRHSFFHVDDASFGKVPFKKIGEFGVPVIVCREVFVPAVGGVVEATQSSQAEALL